MMSFGKDPATGLLPRGGRLTFSQKLDRLKNRLKHHSEWRQYAKLVIGGKILGLAVLAFILFVVPHIPDMLLGGSSAVAQAPAAAAPATAPDPDAAYNA